MKYLGLHPRLVFPGGQKHMGALDSMSSTIGFPKHGQLWFRIGNQRKGKTFLEGCYTASC